MDFTTYTTEQLQALQQQLTEEISNRQIMANAASYSQVASRIFHKERAKGLPEGQPATWIQPTGAHDAYPEGWPVEHNGKVWISLMGANVWEPGVSGWRETTPNPAGVYPQWVQPAGAHDAYRMNDKVFHSARMWRSQVDNNVWSPDQYGWEGISEPVDEIPPEPIQPDAWVQPTGAHDAYQPPTRVTHNGQVWECQVADNVWEPGVHGWQQIIA